MPAAVARRSGGRRARQGRDVRARDRRTFDARPFAGDIDVPTSVVVAGRDRLIHPAEERHLVDAIPGAELVDLDTAHNGWMVRPQQVANALSTARASVAARTKDYAPDLRLT